jgi:hypothetical protein
LGDSAEAEPGGRRQIVAHGDDEAAMSRQPGSAERGKRSRKPCDRERRRGGKWSPWLRGRTGAIGLLLVFAALLVLAVPPASGRADTVTEWNLHATDALIATAAQPPPVAGLHLAMVQGAVYDAVNAIDRRYEPYLAVRPARRWYSRDAAAATAAYRVLVDLVPAQQGALEGLYAASLASLPGGKAKEGGIAVGESAASAMLAARANDGRFGPFTFPVGTAPGQWRPVPPAFVNAFGWLGRVKPFLIDSPSRFRSDGPNSLTSARYAREFAEVKSLGSLTGSTRTPEQTDVARFWADHDVALWSRVYRQLALRHRLGSARGARLLAMLYLTAADAGIACFDDKAHWHFWQTITAIREAEGDRNPATEPDPEWLPLIENSPFPDHPSGLACVSGSIVRTLRDFFDTDRADFSAFSARSGTTRSYSRFSQAIEEIIDARVYAGVHFRTADEQGARLGGQVARWRESHYFRPVLDSRSYARAQRAG